MSSILNDIVMIGWDTEIFIIQGESRQDLIDSGRQLLRFISGSPDLELKDLAYTLNCPLQGAGRHLAIVADSLNELEKKLQYAIQRLSDPLCTKIKDRSGIFFFEEPLSREGTLAFIFPGEGSQYVNMLSDLCQHYPEVRSCFERADQVFLNSSRDLLPSQLLFPPDFDQSEADHPSEEEIWQMDIAVISVFTANHAMYGLLDLLEIRPQAMVGHSSGEFAALLASGAILDQDEDHIIQYTLEAVRIIQSMEKQMPEAKLVALGNLDSNILPSMVEKSNGSIYLAMDNCPHQTILCVPEKEFPCFLDQMKNQGVIFNTLPFQRAYHTSLFQPISDELSHLFLNLNIVPPQIKIYSCSSAKPFPQDPNEIRRLAAGQWSRPVRFRETIEAMYNDGVRIFVEVGPKGNLTGFVDDILQNRQYLAVPSNVPHQTGISQLHYLIGLLAAHGVHLNLEHLYKHREPRYLSLEKVFGYTDKLTKENNSTNSAQEELPKWNSGKDSQGTDTNLPNNFQVDSSHQTTNYKSRIMREYLQTMEQFVETQQEVLAAFMDRTRKVKQEIPKEES